MAEKHDTWFPLYPELAFLKREPTETDYEWQKRLGRERARIRRRANIPLGAPKVRTGGSQRGLLPPDLAAELAQRDGETEADWKRRYSREVMRRWRSDPANKKKAAARRRELYEQNGPGEAKIVWKAANKDRQRTYSRKDVEKNKDKKLAALDAWRSANSDRVRQINKEWAEQNRDKIAASAARIRARIIQATPAWADWKQIEKFYTLAQKMTRQTGIPHQVDHIVPLNGKNVRGLHVHYNLRVITATENMTKHNRFDPSLIEAA